MGAIGGLLGLNGGASGSGYAAPQGTYQVDPVNQQQITATTNANDAALAQQQNLVSALQAQNGLGNQSNVYNQLQGVANGMGPNPAQAMLNQATGANVANQAALMAGQRGTSANAGLLARNAAMQGGNLQQQAAGQGATMQANQSLNALNSAGNIANTQAANQIGATQAYTGAQQAEQANLFGAAQGRNANNIAMQSNINTTNAGLAGKTMEGQQGLIGGVMNGVGRLFGAEGGVADTVAPTAPPPAMPAKAGPKSSFGKFLSGMAPDVAAPAQQTGPDALQSGMSSLVAGIGNALKPGPQAMPAGPALDVNPDVVNMAAQGGMTHDYRQGGKVQAKSSKEKAVKAGNSYANDKIPAVLSEKEIVLPRSVTLSKDPVGASAKFVAAVLAKRRAGGK